MSRLPSVQKQKTCELKNEKAEENHKRTMVKISGTNIQSNKAVKFDNMVLVKQKQATKHDSIFNPNPYRVISKNGTMITARNTSNHEITRNISHFKRIPETVRPLSNSANNVQLNDLVYYNSLALNRAHIQIPTIVNLTQVPVPASPTIPNDRAGPLAKQHHTQFDPEITQYETSSNSDEHDQAVLPADITENALSMTHQLNYQTIAILNAHIRNQ
ncbi:hypothetical protein BpHYR1_033732 [Brachionus plicatilis]|uniref:Uncharacterized protein n=1 Tax=Brachionus plicatilis TaxID=10195 RepID=A0A3M7RVM1_BRAPC|nr:hypothetical protein BpHYR1_033732 [Brachionus plicatilis]